MSRKIVGGVLFLVLIILTACSSPASSDQASPKAPEKEVLSNKLASTMEEIFKEGPGLYSGDKYDEEKVKAELDTLPKEATKEQVFNKIVALVGEDYQPEKKAYDDFDPIVRSTVDKPSGEAGVPEAKATNMAILLDSSGSMRGKVSGGEKMAVAKSAINHFIATLPKEANVSLTVYGHKGGNREAEKETSCAAIEEVYPLGIYEKEKFEQTLTSIQPKGWTPLAAAIQQAEGVLTQQKRSNNVVFIVSDGLETCGGDPVKEAQALSAANIAATVNIIGFDVSNQDQQALKKVAEAGKGSFYSAQSKHDLKEYFKKQNSILRQQWRDYESELVQKISAENSKKSAELHEIYNKFNKKVKLEYDRIGIMSEYLSKKRNTKNHVYFQASRHAVVREYYQKRYNELSEVKDKNLYNSYDEKDEEVEKNMESLGD